MSLFTDENVITENYNKFMKYIEADSRAESLVEMYKIFHDELITAPASGKIHFHNCYPGGYLDHVLRVTETALRVAALYKETGGTVDFTKEELIFAALHHDFGKLGTEDQPYYIDQDSDWHRKKGQYYVANENIQYFRVPERGLVTLQRYGISVTEKEWLAIKLSDGMYDESNKAYYMSYSPNAMKTNLPYIIHWADHLSCRVENDKSRFI
jgi:predicted HD phosphohydrolase